MRLLSCMRFCTRDKYCVRCWQLLKLLDQGNVVSLQQDLADFAPLLGRVLLRKRDFDGVVNDKVHELVKALATR